MGRDIAEVEVPEWDPDHRHSLHFDRGTILTLVFSINAICSSLTFSDDRALQEHAGVLGANAGHSLISLSDHTAVRERLIAIR